MQMYKGQNIENYKKIMIVLIILIFFLLFINLILSGIQKKSNVGKELNYESLSTIEEVIKYYESKFISMNDSELEEFDLDIKLKLKYLPYDKDDNSYEEYYNNLLKDSAKVLGFKDFRFIDEENQIIIEVICSKGRIDSIKINGIEDYFIYMDSQISMKQYVEIPLTKVQPVSNKLIECIDNNWSASIDFGSRDSIFDRYYIYFDEGYKVRIIDGKIYNIIFTKEYKDSVVENFFPGISNKQVEKILGKPTFEDKKLKLIGYKTEKFYIFFNEKEISIYRNSTIEAEDFFDLAEKYNDESIDFLDFMNQLTYLWPDYSDYEYTSKSVYLSYPLKGLEICVNNGDINGFLVYNNIRSSMSKINRILENTNYVARLQIDLVFKKEKERIEKYKNYKTLVEEYYAEIDDETKEIIGTSMNYIIFPIKDNNDNISTIKFISKDEDGPDRELNDGIDTYAWYNNNYFVYSKLGKGLYVYNVTDGYVQNILQGKENYNIKGISNGTIYYDKKEIQLGE